MLGIERYSVYVIKHKESGERHGLETGRRVIQRIRRRNISDYVQCDICAVISFAKVVLCFQQINIKVKQRRHLMNVCSNVLDYTCQFLYSISVKQKPKC